MPFRLKVVELDCRVELGSIEASRPPCDTQRKRKRVRSKGLVLQIPYMNRVTRILSSLNLFLTWSPVLKRLKMWWIKRWVRPKVHLFLWFFGFLWLVLLLLFISSSGPNHGLSSEVKMVKHYQALTVQHPLFRYVRGDSLPFKVFCFLAFFWCCILIIPWRTFYHTSVATYALQDLWLVPHRTLCTPTTRTAWLHPLPISRLNQRTKVSHLL